MRNYYFLASERINSLYNQLAAGTPNEIITKQSNKKGTHIEGKLSAEGGLFGLFKGTGGISGSANKENTFEENIRSRIELEHKLGAIEKSITFISVEEALIQNKITAGLPVHFNGAFYSKGLKSRDYYHGNEWDGETLPFLHRNLEGIKIKVIYSPLHFISNSVWGNMKIGGKLNIDGIGFVLNEDREEIVITPLGFGILIPDELASLLR
jgi:hypothetical protein